MADFQYVRIIGVLLSNTKHLLTLRRSAHATLLLNCIGAFDGDTSLGRGACGCSDAPRAPHH
jgi:hypothetical protein